MAKTGSKDKAKKKVETLTHGKASRLNIPTAEYQSVMRTEELSPIRVAYERRNRDLDPQLVWKGKDEQDWSDLVVPAPPLYIQEKIHPKVLIDDLQRRSEANTKASEAQIDLFASFNGLPSEGARTEFYQHDAHLANRMILGDSLQVMASLAEREGLIRSSVSWFRVPLGGGSLDSHEFGPSSAGVTAPVSREVCVSLFHRMARIVERIRFVVCAVVGASPHHFFGSIAPGECPFGKCPIRFGLAPVAARHRPLGSVWVLYMAPGIGRVFQDRKISKLMHAVGFVMHSANGKPAAETLEVQKQSFIRLQAEF